MLEQFFITTQILIIDVVMAADNAIIIGLIAANFAPDNRKKIIAWGVAAAFIFRIFFATGANYIFEFAWVKILGGVLLIWVINNLRQDFESGKQSYLNNMSVKKIQAVFEGSSRLAFLKDNYVCESYIQRQGNYVNPCDYIEIVSNDFYAELINNYYYLTQNYDI